MALRTAARRTAIAAATTLRRRDTLAVFIGVTLGYLLFYLYAIGHLAPGSGQVELFVVDRPLDRLFDRSFGTFSFEPVARFELGAVTYLFSLDTVIGVGLALLVGLNLSLTALLWRQPKACGIGTSSTAAVAGIPALLSGAACCAPVVLIVLGIQATGVLLTAFEFLLPLAAVFLIASLLLVGRQIDPAAR